MEKMTLELDHFEPNKTIVKIHTNKLYRNKRQNAG